MANAVNWLRKDFVFGFGEGLILFCCVEFCLLEMLRWVVNGSGFEGVDIDIERLGR